MISANRRVTVTTLRDDPRLSIATVICIAIALGVFGTLPVQEGIGSGGTALAVAAQPTLGDAGYLLVSITALFATAGATDAGLHPAIGLCDQLTANGTFPPVLGRRIAQRVSVALLVAAALAWYWQSGSP
jgi:hypothetical protein